MSETRSTIARGALESALSVAHSSNNSPGTNASADADADANADANADAGPAGGAAKPGASAAHAPACRPEFESSWLSRTFFLWFNPLVAHGKNHPLTEHDVPPFAPPDRRTAAIAREKEE